MGYGKYLRQLLEPLKIYELSAGAGVDELECVGTQLDAISDSLENTERESLTVTAQDTGLEMLEKSLPFVPLSVTASDRRRAIQALLRIDSRSFTLSGLNDTVAGCGIRARIGEKAAEKTVVVSFPYNRGVPDRMDELKSRIEEILPCHLNVEYTYVYLSWRELAECFPTWADVESVEDWNALECYLPEDYA